MIVFPRNFGFINMQIEGTSINALIKHSRTEKMIRNAKYLIVRNEETNKIKKPNITEKALIVIPLPVVL